jgi:DNA replication protein DnaC
MIHIERKSQPPSLNSPPVEDARAEAEKFYGPPISERKQKHHKFFPLTTKLAGFSKALSDAFNGKCAFCESYVSIDEFSYMHRYRPKSGAIGQDGTASPDHYWWLAYEWSNLYLVCLACNKIRGDRFPITGKRAESKATGEALLKEGPLLLDPCNDFPEDHLVFDEKGMVASDSPQGRTTIETLALNRTPLIRARAEVGAELQTKWLAAVAKVSRGFTPELYRELANEKLSFLGFRRQCLHHWSSDLVATHPRMLKLVKPFLSFRTGVTQKITKPSAKAEKAVVKQTFKRFKTYRVSQERYSVEKESQKDSYYLKSRFIERIEIRNFKVIRELALDFPVDVQEQGSWLLLLGENGTGKTSVLTALALALMGDKQRRKFLVEHKLKASEFVRFGCESGQIKVYLTATPEPIILNFSRRASQFTTNSKEPKVLLLGYGATRLLPPEAEKEGTKKKSSSDGLASKADNLFNPFVALNDAQSWLGGLTESDFYFIARGLKQLLLLDKEELIKDPERKGRILVTSYRSRVPLDDMSAGFQSVVALTADVMSVLRLRWETMEAAEGIVLVDEIDAHLHPRWKMQIVSRLRNAFPRLQFVVTSHDPLCLRGLHGGEVVVMKRDGHGKPIAITDLPSPDSLRVDQILTSEFFGLNTTVEPEIDQAFDRYYKLLAVRKPSASQQAEIAELKSQLRVSQQLGTTRRERVMLEAVDTFLAEQDITSDKEHRAGLMKGDQGQDR